MFVRLTASNFGRRYFVPPIYRHLVVLLGVLGELLVLQARAASLRLVTMDLVHYAMGLVAIRQTVELVVA